MKAATLVSWQALSSCACLTLLFARSVFPASNDQERIPVTAWFGAIDDGSYHVVLLFDDACSLTNLGRALKAAFILNLDKHTSPAACWRESQSTQNKDVFSVQYLSTKTEQVGKFTIDSTMTRQMIYEWRTEKLFAAPAVTKTAKPAMPIAQEQQSQDSSSDRLVRIFVNDNKHRVTGDTVSAAQLHTILFLKEQCTLNLAASDTMRRAWIAAGAYQVGCWYPTIDDEYVFVGQLPSMTFASGAYFEALPLALLHQDGSATITESSYDSATFLRNIIASKTAKRLQSMQQRP